MISDIVCEYLVKRKLSPVQIAKAVGITALCLFATWFLRSVGVIIDRTGMMAFLLLCIGLFATWYISRFFYMIEYEYTLVNGELTVDRVAAQSSRKTLLEVNVKSFEKFGKYDEATVNQLGAGKVLDYSADKADKNTFFAYYKDEKSNVNTVLLFTPNQKMLDAMKSSVNATVYREAFREKKQSQE